MVMARKQHRMCINQRQQDEIQGKTEKLAINSWPVCFYSFYC